MKRLALALLSAWLMLGAWAAAQRPHDPLDDKEQDQLRDAAQKPEERLKLYSKFTAARLLAIDQLRTDPKFSAGRGQQIHDLLQDVNTLVGEIEDNVDSFDQQNYDLRKPLKALIQDTDAWQLRLRTLKDAASKDPVAQRESRDYF